MDNYIYEGFVLCRVSSKLTEAQVIQFLHHPKHLGSFKWRNETPEVQVCAYPNQKSGIVIVRGALVEWEKIKSGLYGKFLLDRPVLEIRKYFGIQILPDGMFEGGAIAIDLYHRLCRAKRDLPPIRVPRQDFVEQCGAVPGMTDVLEFDAPKNLFQPNELQNCLFYNQLMYRGEDGNQKPVPFRMSLQYLYRMEALQDFCRLNMNPRATKDNVPRSIVLTDKSTREEVYPQLPPRAGIGKDGTLLDIRSFMQRFRYIPLDQLDDTVFDLNLLKTMTGACYICHTNYTVKGLDPNMGLLIGFCKCTGKSKGDDVEWHKQDFITLTLDFRDAKMVDKYGEKSESLRLIPVINGISPLYSTVREFQGSALQAAHIDYAFERNRMMEKHHCIGVVTCSEEIETVIVKSKPKKRVLVKIEVTKTNFWTRDNDSSISKINLIQRTSTEPMTLKELNKNNLAGKFHGIRHHPTDRSLSVVTAVMTVSPKVSIKVNDHVTVIPKPFDSEVKALNRTASKWLKYVGELQFGPQAITGVIANDERIDLTEPGPVGPVRALNIVVDGMQEKIAEVAEMLEDKYIGVDLIMKVLVKTEYKNCSFEGRILQVIDSDDGQSLLQVLCPIQPSINIAFGEVTMSVWAIQPDLGVRDIRQDSAPLMIDDANDEEGEDDIFEFEDDAEDDDDESYTDSRIFAMPLPPGPVPTTPTTSIVKVITLHSNTASRLLKFTADSFEEAVKNWMHKPASEDYSLCNLLLHPSKVIVHETEPTFSNPRRQQKFEEMQAKIIRNMNPSQKKAITGVVNNRVSLIHGPPGTGKSTTGAAAIAYLHCEERGMIVACAPSNFAADVFYQKLLETNAKHELGMKIMRVMSMSNERFDIVPKADNYDPRILHHAVVTHRDWKVDEMGEIVAEIQSGKKAELKKDKILSFQKHVSAIELKILQQQDVIVCTVATVGDGRLDRLSNRLANQNRKYIGLFIDEASLLRIPSTILPLSIGASRVVLLGDTLQLPPVSLATSSDYAGLTTSWMEMLMLTPIGRDEGVHTLLDIQYRMHPKIGAVVSNLTYKGKVRSAHMLNDRVYEYANNIYEHFPEMSNDNRIVFYSYAQSEQEAQPESGSKSFVNFKEIDIIRQILLELDAAGVHMSHVSIIAGYQLQVYHLMKTLEREGSKFSQVQVGTVDSFQGKENKIVIVSFVRSNKENSIGFFFDQRRVNVAISRAMEFLFIVGDKKTLIGSGIKFVSNMFNIIDENGGKVVNLR